MSLTFAPASVAGTTGATAALVPTAVCGHGSAAMYEHGSSVMRGRDWAVGATDIRHFVLRPSNVGFTKQAAPPRGRPC